MPETYLREEEEEEETYLAGKGEEEAAQILVFHVEGVAVLHLIF